MYILTFRTDTEEAEIGLYNAEAQMVYKTWQAHRELAETINTKIVDVLMEGDVRLHQLEGVVVFQGPGSFTGLRIGVSVANALAYSLNIPVVGVAGNTWLDDGIAKLLTGQNDLSVVPEYGAAPNITKPRH